MTSKFFNLWRVELPDTDLKALKALNSLIFLHPYPIIRPVCTRTNPPTTIRSTRTTYHRTSPTTLPSIRYTGSILPLHHTYLPSLNRVRTIPSTRL